MSPGNRALSLRVALLDHAGGEYALELADALRGEGHEARVLPSGEIAPVEALLRRRGFTPSLTHVPLTAAALLRGGFDLAHSFSATDAAAALAWRRLTGRPVVFTCVEALSRGSVADARLRLRALRSAVDDADVLTVASEESSVALERWFAVSAPVLAAREVSAHEALYRDLLTGPGDSG